MSGIVRYLASAFKGDSRLALDSSERKADQSFAFPILSDYSPDTRPTVTE
jgi:hypothetical protein